MAATTDRSAARATLLSVIDHSPVRRCAPTPCIEPLPVDANRRSGSKGRAASPDESMIPARTPTTVQPIAKGRRPWTDSRAFWLQHLRGTWSR